MFGRSILFNRLLSSPWRHQSCRIWLEMKTYLWGEMETSLWDEADPGQPKEQPPGRQAVCCQKLHFSAAKVPAQQQAGRSDHTALGFFLGDFQSINLFGPVDLSHTVQNHCPAYAGTGCKPCSGGASLFWCSWLSLEGSADPRTSFTITSKVRKDTALETAVPAQKLESYSCSACDFFPSPSYSYEWPKMKQ